MTSFCPVDDKDSVPASFLKVDMEGVESKALKVVSAKLTVVGVEVVQTTAAL